MHPFALQQYLLSYMTTRLAYAEVTPSTISRTLSKSGLEQMTRPRNGTQLKEILRTLYKSFIQVLSTFVLPFTNNVPDLPPQGNSFQDLRLRRVRL